MEELRLLGNLEAKHGKAVQIILVAQPTLGKTLRLPELASFGQRLLVRFCSEPMVRSTKVCAEP